MLSIPFFVFAKQKGTIETNGSKPVLTSEISVLKDSLQQFSFSDVTNVHAEKLFKPYGETAFDLTSKTYWLRVSVHSTNKKPVSWMLKIPSIDTSEFFIPDGVDHLVTGIGIPFVNWAVPYAEFPYLPVQVKDSVTTYYIRLTSATKFSFELRNLKAIKFVGPESFELASHTSRYFHGIFLGIMFAMIILNIIIYLIYRERAYLVYALFMITHTLWHLSITGYLLEFVFYHHPRIGKHFLYEIAGISLMSYVFFSQVYLESKKYTPRLNKLYNWLYLLIVVDIFMGCITNIKVTNSILLLLGIIVIVFPFFMAIINYRHKYLAGYSFSHSA